jgi:RPA family protein
VLPPLAKDASTDKRDPDYVVTVLALILYIAVVAGVLVLLDID